MTLDGVTQGLGGPEEDTEGGFEHGGCCSVAQALWSVGQGLSETTAYLFGRKTYEKMAAHWPHEPDSNPVAASLNAAPKYVVSNTLNRGRAGAEPRSSPWRGRGRRRPAKGGRARAPSRCSAASPGPDPGVEHDLIDEYRIFVHPLVPGAGEKLFREYSRPLKLRLAACTQTTTGVLLLGYEPESQDNALMALLLSGPVRLDHGEVEPRDARAARSLTRTSPTWSGWWSGRRAAWATGPGWSSTSADLDGPPLGALTWPGTWVVTAQLPGRRACGWRGGTSS